MKKGRQIDLRGPLYLAAGAQMSSKEGSYVVTRPKHHQRDFAQAINEIQLRAAGSPATPTSNPAKYLEI